MNKVILVGRLTADPELRQTPNGVASCQFTVAVTRNRKNQNGEYESDFIRCVAWRTNAEFIARYFTKGKMIGIEGTLRTGSYADRNHSDVTHYTTDVWIDNVEFVGGKNESGGNGGGYQNNGYGAPQGNGYNNSFQAPPQQAQYQQPAPSNDGMSYGSSGEFEEILSDGDVPF
jgi:single-strand DNA-binding protein